MYKKNQLNWGVTVVWKKKKPCEYSIYAKLTWCNMKVKMKITNLFYAQEKIKMIGRFKSNASLRKAYLGLTIPRWPSVPGFGGMVVFAKFGGKLVDFEQSS